MNKRKNLEEKVYHILATIPDTRSDDYLLIYYVIGSFLYEKGITPPESFFEIMVSHRSYDLPSLEGITRTRRRLQAKHEEIRADLEKIEKESKYKSVWVYIHRKLKGIKY